MTTLVSFLGRARRSEAGGPARPGYRRTRYRFPSGNVSDETAYSGIALRHEIRPDRLVVLGTSGSMWDVFFDDLAEPDGDALEDLVALAEAMDEERVDAAMLDRHAGRLADALGMAPGGVACRLIGRADDLPGQVAILGAIADAVPPGDRLVIDVTHGYRHLPMLALVAASYLARVRDVTVQGLHYAAFEMRDGDEPVPVLELGGLLHMLDWVEALALYDGNGDYTELARRLAGEGLDTSTANQLERGAHLERANNVPAAHATLYSPQKVLAETTSLSPLGELFRPELQRRLAWTRERKDGSREYALAEAYVQRRDYLRAAVLMVEGTVTRSLSLEGRANPGKPEDRQEQNRKLRKSFPCVRELSSIRNALAHGTRPHDKEVARTLKDPAMLHDAMMRLLGQVRALEHGPAD